MKTKKQIKSRLIEIKEENEQFRTVNARAGDYDLNTSIEGQIEILEWVLDEDLNQSKDEQGGKE